jgi:Winged helix DNA-binding domain
VPRRRVLSERELNRALLARQLLLERAKAPIPKVLERMGALQAQYAPSMYVGLFSRIEGFRRDQLDRALNRAGVAQGTLMRATIHLVSAADYWPIAIGVRRGRREAWLGASYRREYSARQMAAAARKLRTRLGDGTMSRKEIHELLGSDSVITNGVNMWLDLVRVPPSGTWERRRADLYAAADRWLGAPPKELDERAGIELLVRRYLGAFGPASVSDLANWAGLHPRWVKPVVDSMELRSFSDETGGELVDLPRAPLPDAETAAPPRFIGTWDAMLLAHARRAGVMPERHRSKVFDPKYPQSTPTFLVDGRVAGSWKFEKGKVKLRPFEKLDPSAKRELAAEGDRLAELHA